MFNFHLYNGSMSYRLFMSLTVALCIWGIMSMTGQAQELGTSGIDATYQESESAKEGSQEFIYHVHEGDALLGGGCYGTALFHEHSGSKSSGNGCYKTPVTHSHIGSEAAGGGCYGQSLYHSHTGSSAGGGCYQSAVCHTHSGNSEAGNGCYTTPIYHAHQGDEMAGGGCYVTPVYHQHEGVSGSATPNGCYTKEEIIYVETERCGSFEDVGNDNWRCDNCGWTIASIYLPFSKKHVPQVPVEVYVPNCGKNEETLEGYALSCGKSSEDIEGYELGCGKESGTVERYNLSCGKDESSVEGYALTCSLQEGQIVEYKRNCGMSTSDIVGYALSCGMDEQTVVGVKEAEVRQPVKVPVKLTYENEPVEQIGVKTEDVVADGAMAEGAVAEGVLAEGDAMTEDVVKDTAMADTAVVEMANDVTPEASIRMDLEAATPFAIGAALLILASILYFKGTVALYYYDDANRYHSLGRIRFKQTKDGYHVKIGTKLRRKATTDRYRIRSNKAMQKAAENASLFVSISSRVMKLGLREYVDFAL